MSSIADWADLMTDSITIEPFISRDHYGVASYGPPAAYACRVNYKNTYRRRPDNSVVVGRGTAYIARTAVVNPADRVTFSDGEKPIVLDSNLVTDEAGPLYVSLQFG